MSSFMGKMPSASSSVSASFRASSLPASSIMIVSVLFPCSDGPRVTSAVFLSSPLRFRMRATLNAACIARPLACLTRNIAIDRGPILCSPT